MCPGVEGSRQTDGGGEMLFHYYYYFFLLDALEFPAIKINLCESGLSLQDLVTFTCLHIKFNKPVCESNHSHNNRFSLGCHLSGFGQEQPNWAAGFQLFMGAGGWLAAGELSLLCGFPEQELDVPNGKGGPPSIFPRPRFSLNDQIDDSPI